MKKDLAILLVAMCFVALMAIVVIADNESDESSINFVITDNNVSNNASNMTFGKCVAESAKIRQGCYAEDKNVSKQCVSTAKAGKDKKAAKTCVSDYKESKKSCKVSFQEAKKTCIQTYKPKFWEKMKFIFK